MILRFRNFTRNLLFLLDLLLINLTSYFLGSFSITLSNAVARDSHIMYTLFFNLTWILLVLIEDPYRPVTFVNVAKTTIRLLISHFLLLNTMFFLFYRDLVSRDLILTHYMVLTCCIFLIRTGFLIMYREFGFFRKEKRKAVIIGNGEVSFKAANYLSRPDSGYQFVGVFNDSPDPTGRLPLLGKKKECIDYCIGNDVREIFSTVMPESGEDFRDMIHRAENACIRVKYLPDFKTIFSRDVNMSIENDLLMIRFRDEKLEKFENRFIKRAFDLAFTSLLAILILWWLVPIIYLAIRLTSRGPVFFIQKRSGRDGRVFDCYKFRTMIVNPEADLREARPDDERLTPLGAFLRRTSLDELPQFLNVVKGEMSIVGPRPHMLKHTQEYRKLINRYMVRHFLKPGITGWAQTNGCRGDLTGNRMEERLRKDIWYIENWSFLLDIQIILKTIRLVILGDKNAY